MHDLQEGHDQHLRKCKNTYKYSRRNYRIKGGITCLGIKLHQKRIDKFVLEI